MRAFPLGAIVVATVLSPGLPAFATATAPGGTVSGALTYEGRTVNITHVACRSTSWPLTFLVFTTTAVPREVLSDETTKHDFLKSKGHRGSILQ